MRSDESFLDASPFIEAVVLNEPNICSSKVPPPSGETRHTNWEGRIPEKDNFEVPLLEAAAHDNVDLILSGWGGDEMTSFNGRGVYAEHFAKARWVKLWREIEQRSKVSGMKRHGVFAVEVLQYILPSIVYDQLRRVFGKNPDLGYSDDMEEYLTVHGRKYLPEGIRLRASAAKNRLALFNEGHIDFRLESYAMDGAEWGIQYAFPMLDKSLLEYAVRLPASFFMRHGKRRAVFREAMRDVLPEKVRTFLPKNRPFPSLDLRIS